MSNKVGNMGVCNKRKHTKQKLNIIQVQKKKLFPKNLFRLQVVDKINV